MLPASGFSFSEKSDFPVVVVLFNPSVEVYNDVVQSAPPEAVQSAPRGGATCTGGVVQSAPPVLLTLMPPMGLSGTGGTVRRK